MSCKVCGYVFPSLFFVTGEEDPDTVECPICHMEQTVDHIEMEEDTGEGKLN